MRVPLILALLASCAAPTRSAVPETLSVATANWRVLGESREGRPVRATDLGAGGPRVAIVAGIHGNEQEGLRHLDELLGVVDPLPATVRIYEDANPDGTAANRRGTSTGVDPNRNWPASNFKRDPRRGPSPLSEPAVAAIHADLVAFEPQLVFVLHSTPRGPFVNYDGPGQGFAERFVVGAGAPWTVKPSMGYPTPGSIGTWVGVDQQIPILTIEFRRGCAPEDSGPALMRGMTAVLRDGPVPAAESAPRVD
jgi:protein MpaA